MLKTRLIKPKKPITFAVRILTANRKKFLPVPEILGQAIESVKDQTYPHWRIYLIGDKYEPHEEFLSFRKLVPPDKIVMYNLRNHQPDRFLNLSQKTLSMFAGQVAGHYSLDIIQAMGDRYIANLDDDDLWNPNHLELIYKELCKFNPPALVCTMANFKYTDILPTTRVQPDNTTRIETLARNVAHSSVCWDSHKLPLRYRNLWRETPWSPDYSDADMWARMEHLCAEKGYNIAVVPEITVEVR
jgi:glycosyltransferase involved in cell wall biosynthesis